MTGLAFPTRDDWLAARQSRIGGSEVAALFGCEAPYQLSHYALWQVKAGKIPAPDVAGERPEWGLRLEAAIAEAHAERFGWKIEKGGYVPHPTVAGMACTLDFEIVGGHPRVEIDGPGVLEIKNVDWLQKKRTWGGSEPPVHILLQGQHQCGCAGRKWGVIGSLIGGNELAEPYEFDARPKLIKSIEQKVAAFWQSIERGEEPPVDGSGSTSAALAEMFPESVAEKSIDLSGHNEFPERFADLKQARLDRQAAEKCEAAAANWIMRCIGDAELLRYSGQIVATAKSSKRRGYTVEPTIIRPLRLKEE